MIWKSRNRLVGASAFIFITAVAGPSSTTLQTHKVLPNNQLNHKHVTPVAAPAAPASIKIYRYLQQNQLKFIYITPVAAPEEPPDSGTPEGTGGALIMGGYRLAYRKAMLKQAREEDEFLIEAIAAIIELL